MDIQLARTFLEVIAAGNFVNAASRLLVTQSAVSLRIRKLEEELGRPVFLRTKSGVALTPAGQQFLRYATSMVKVWEEARHQVAIPPGYRDTLVVGGQYSLWDNLLLRWLASLERQLPDVAFRAELGMPDRLMRMMVEGILDIGVMYNPQLRPGLEVTTLIEDELVLVSTSPTTGPELDDSYVFIDWGPEFQAAHALRYPKHTNPGTTLSLGAMGLNFVLATGRAGYFPTRVVKRHLDSGRLTLVQGAPVFPYPAYVVYHTETDAELLDAALAELHAVAQAVDEQQQTVITELGREQAIAKADAWRPVIGGNESTDVPRRIE